MKARQTGIVRYARLAAGALLTTILPVAAQAEASAPAPAAKAALTVSAVQPLAETWPQTIHAHGNVVPWQEAQIGAEIGGYRITEVRAEIGQTVRKGQVLARIADEMVKSELEEARAAAAEAEAQLTDAKANAERARALREKGFYSAQGSSQILTAEQTAMARLSAARARLQASELRLAKLQIVAPDGGVISARSATVGSLTQPGQELFRLIRGGRLEWRAEVPGADMARLKPGMAVSVRGASGQAVPGKLRIVAPSIDAQTRNGLVYVDIDSAGATAVGLRAGSYVRGEIELTRAEALTVPQTAVVLREGFAYVFRLEGAGKVAQAKVRTGRRVGDRIEIVDGLGRETRIVESGAAFLADGDTVKVVEGRTTK